MTSVMQETEYLEAVRRATYNGPAGPWLTRVCPECGKPVQPGDTDHTMVGPFVAVGCEGYWVVNPEALGLPRGTWAEWRILNDEEAARYNEAVRCGAEHADALEAAKFTTTEEHPMNGTTGMSVPSSTLNTTEEEHPTMEQNTDTATALAQAEERFVKMVEAYDAVTTELAAAKQEAHLSRTRLLDFKGQVRDRTIQAMEQHDLCREGVNDYLADLGLDLVEVEWTARVTETYLVTIEREFTVEATDEETAKELAGEFSCDDSELDGYIREAVDQGNVEFQETTDVEVES